jgi:hypothetical protein
MIENQRHLFDIPEGITYLNCAYLSPLLLRTAQAGIEGIGRKVHPWTIVRRDFFSDLEEARGLFARLVGASADDIAIVPASSYAAALAGANLPLGKGRLSWSSRASTFPMCISGNSGASRSAVS